MFTFIEYLKEISGIPPIPAQKVGRRRKYSHKFSADKVYYLDYDKFGRPYWRKKSAESIVFFGKQQDHDDYDK